jgi:FkbM family methyltransferase
MSILESLARKVAGALGRESRVVRALRPAYERLLEIASGGRGYLHTLNGSERFYIRPRHRPLYPATYDVPVMNYLRARVRPGHVALNPGANAGVYALCLARWAGPTGHVYAFEPNPAIRAVLDDTARRSGLAGCLTSVPDAIGAETGSATFMVSDSSGLSRLGQPNPEARDVAHHAVAVGITTIDRFCADRHLRPDWLMMDIEGYEVAALRGARETIRAGRGRLGIVLEMHPALWEMSGSSRSDVERLLAELGLVPVALAGQIDPLGEKGIVRLEYRAD